jgi:hypothetical protein
LGIGGKIQIASMLIKASENDKIMWRHLTAKRGVMAWFRNS